MQQINNIYNRINLQSLEECASFYKIFEEPNVSLILEGITSYLLHRIERVVLFCFFLVGNAAMMGCVCSALLPIGFAATPLMLCKDNPISSIILEFFNFFGASLRLQWNIAWATVNPWASYLYNPNYYKQNPVIFKELETKEYNQQLIETGKKALNQICELASSNETPENKRHQAQKIFKENFRPLCKLIKNRLEGLLSESPKQKYDSEEINPYSQFHKQMKTLLKVLSIDKDNEDYRDYLNDDKSTWMPIFNFYKNDSKEAKELLPDDTEIVGERFKRFLFDCKSFRMQYLCRFRSNKVMAFIQKTSNNAYSENILRYFVEQLLTMTFLSGTQTSTLELIKRTNYYFLPTGKLAEVGTVAAAGELGRGCSSKGVNKHSLSGTDLANSERAEEYAFSGGTKSIGENYAEIQTFVSSKNPIPGPSLAMAILRYRAWDEEDFTTNWKPLVEKNLQLFYEKQKKEESEKENSECMLAYNQALNYLTQSITSLTIDEKYAMWYGQPMIYASSSKIPKPKGYALYCSETLLRNGGKLGKDIQHIFVRSNDVNTVRKWLVNQGMDSVQVHSLYDLAEARKIMKLAHSYLADII